MKLAVIPTWQRNDSELWKSESEIDLWLAQSDGIQMALTHLVENHFDYAVSMHKRSMKGDYIILDNSIVELGAAMSFGQVLQAAAMISADEVVLPDVFYDSAATKQRVEETLDDYGKPDFKYMAVCHAENLNEFMNLFNWLNANDYIDTIGIPKCGLKDGTTREMVLNRIMMNRTADDKPIHLLGANGPESFRLPRKWREMIRSIDTVYPLWMAQHEEVLFPDTTFIKRPEGMVLHDTLGWREGNKTLYGMNNVAIVKGWLND